MSAYVIADVTVNDADQMAKYREWSTKVAAEFGASFIVRGGAITVFEGDWQPGRVVILQFADSAPAVAAHVAQQLGLEHTFIDIDNPA